MDRFLVPVNNITGNRNFPETNNVENIYKGSLFSDLFLKNVYERMLFSENIIFQNDYLDEFSRIMTYINANRNSLNEETTKNRIIMPILRNYLGYNEAMFLYETPLPIIRTDYLLIDGELNHPGEITEDDKFRITTVIECKKPSHFINLDPSTVATNQNNANYDQIRNYLCHSAWRFRFGIWTNGFIWVLFKKEFGNIPYICFDLLKIFHSPKKNNYFFLFFILFRKKNLLERNNNNNYNLEELYSNAMRTWNDFRLEFDLNNRNFRDRKENVMQHLRLLYSFFFRFNSTVYNEEFIFAFIRKIYIYILYIFMTEHKQKHYRLTTNDNVVFIVDEIFINNPEVNIEMRIWNKFIPEVTSANSIFNILDNQFIIFLSLIDPEQFIELNLSFKSILKSIFLFDSINRIDFSGFNSIVLGKIYELTIGTSLSPNQQTIIWNNNLLAENGIYYTPSVLVDDMVKRTLKSVIASIPLNEIRIIDPSMGRGNFLLGCVRYLMANVNQLIIPPQFNLRSDDEILKFILMNCIYGVELFRYSVGIAKASLILENNIFDEEVINSIGTHLICGDSVTGLVNPTQSDIEQYNNDYERMKDSYNDLSIEIKELFYDQYDFSTPFIFREVFSDILRSGGFTVVIGNPPWKILKIVSPKYDNINNNHNNNNEDSSDDNDGDNNQKIIVQIYNNFISSRARRFNMSNLGRNLWIMSCLVNYEILKQGGKMNFIVPQTLIGGSSCSAVRSILFSNGQLERLMILNAKYSRVLFPSIDIMTCIFILTKRSISTSNVLLSIYLGYVLQNNNHSNNNNNNNNVNNVDNGTKKTIEWKRIDRFNSASINMNESVPKIPSLFGNWSRINPTFVKFSESISTFNNWERTITQGSPFCNEATLRRRRLLVSIVKSDQNATFYSQFYYNDNNRRETYIPAVKGINIHFMTKVFDDSDLFRIMNNDYNRYFINSRITAFRPAMIENNWTIAIMAINNGTQSKKIIHSLVPPNCSCLHSCNVIHYPIMTNVLLTKKILFLLSGMYASDYIDFCIRLLISNMNMPIDALYSLPFFSSQFLSQISFQNNILKINLQSRIHNFKDYLLNDFLRRLHPPYEFIQNNNNESLRSIIQNPAYLRSIEHSDYTTVISRNEACLISLQYEYLIPIFKSELLIFDPLVNVPVEDVIIYIFFLSRWLYKSTDRVDRFIYILFINQCVNNLFKIEHIEVEKIYNYITYETNNKILCVELLTSIMNSSNDFFVNTLNHLLAKARI